MPVYTVHAPIAGSANPSARADKTVFVRDGFYVWALVFGPLWLAFHRLWLALIGYLVVTGALEGAMALLHTPEGAQGWAMLLLNVLLGFEASTLRRWTLKRKGFAHVGVAVGKNIEDAERNFFARAVNETLSRQGGSRENASRPADAGSNIAPLTQPGSPGANPPPVSQADASRGVIGLFPEPGGSR